MVLEHDDFNAKRFLIKELGMEITNFGGMIYPLARLDFLLLSLCIFSISLTKM